MQSIKSQITKYWKYYLTIFLVAFSISYSIIGINKPFTTGHLDNINARQGTWNENFIQHGYFKMKFGTLASFDKDNRCLKSGYYINHPSFGPILYSLPAWLLGNKEWSIRIVPLLIFLFNLFLLYKIISHIFDSETGLIAVIIYSFLPVNRIYNMLPDYYGPLFFTYTLLIIYFIFKYDREEKTKYEILFFTVYFFSLLHDWFSIVNFFVILLYYLFFKRKKIYKGLFFLVTLTNAAFLLNFLHIYLLTGSFMVDKIFRQFIYRKGEINFINSLFLLHNFEIAFGIAAITAAIAGILVFYKIRNKKYKFILHSQIITSLFLLIMFKGALEIHWFLFMNFSLLITLAILSILKFSKERGYFIFKLLLPAILFLIILSSQSVINEYRQDGVHCRGRFNKNRCFLEYKDDSAPHYILLKKFLETTNYNSEETLILLRDPGFYKADYYLAINGYCFDTAFGNPFEYNNLKGFENIVFIELDENNNLKIEKTK